MGVERVRRNGTYAPLSSRYYYDDAIDEAGEGAEVLFCRGLAFCAGSGTDGLMTQRQVARLVGIGLPDLDNRIKALTEVGLWVPTADGSGWQVRSWLKWNRSAAEIDEACERDALRKRAARSGAVRSDVRADSETPSVRSPQHSTDTDTRQIQGSPRTFGPRGEPPAHAPDPCAPEGRPAPPPPALIADLRATLAQASRKARNANLRAQKAGG